MAKTTPKVVNVDISMDGRPLGSIQIPVPEVPLTRLGKLIGKPFVVWFEEAITSTLLFCDCHYGRTAETLGIGERTLYRKVKEFGIDVAYLNKCRLANKMINKGKRRVHSV